MVLRTELEVCSRQDNWDYPRSERELRGLPLDASYRLIKLANKKSLKLLS